MAAAYSSHDIVEDYLHYKLLSRGVAWRCPPPPGRTGGRRPRRVETPHRDPCLAPPPLQVVLRSAGNELARCYRGNLWAQASMLRLCGDGGVAVLQRSLRAVNEELFRDSVNWGRIVAMMELGGALSAEAAEKGDMSQVDAIAGWMEDSLDSPPLQGWIEDNGGWDAFVQLYTSRPPVSVWSLRTVFGLLVLGAVGMALGALFTQK